MGSVLLLTSDYPPRIGGVARYNAALAAALTPPMEVLMLPLIRSWPLRILTITRRCRPGAVDRLVVSELLPWGTVAWIVQMLRRTPYVVVCHGLDLERARRVPRKRWLARRVLAGASRVIANSRATNRRVVACGAPPERVTVIAPPLTDALLRVMPSDRAAFRSVQDIPLRAPLILTVGRLVARKGFDTVIDAMATVIRTLPNARLVVVGDGPERATLEARARIAGIPCHFVGSADDATLASWYEACDVFTMLPRTLPDGDVEGFGMVYLEAGWFRKPVVGTRSGGVPDAITDGVTGLLVPPGDAPAAAIALLRILSDRTLGERLGNEGRQRVEREHLPVIFARAVRAALGVR